MFRVIRVMNSAGPGATGVKKEGARGGEGWRERQWQIEKGKPRKAKLHVCANYVCKLLKTRPDFKAESCVLIWTPRVLATETSRRAVPEGVWGLLFTGTHRVCVKHEERSVLDQIIFPKKYDYFIASLLFPDDGSVDLQRVLGRKWESDGEGEEFK